MIESQTHDRAREVCRCRETGQDEGGKSKRTDSLQGKATDEAVQSR